MNHNKFLLMDNNFSLIYSLFFWGVDGMCKNVLMQLVVGVSEGKREFYAGSMPRIELEVGLDLTTLRS